MFTLNCRGRLLVAEAPLVTGVLNVTPDSFFNSSRVSGNDLLLAVESMLAEGADIIDLGAQSSRPGADPLTADEEISRFGDHVQNLMMRFPELVLSIDTYHARVAEHCLAQGAAIINDISGGSLDPAMLKVVAAAGAPFICMHMRGTPQTMTGLNDYDDLVADILDYFLRKLAVLRGAGIRDIILDPGFGFSKDIAQNFELLRRFADLKVAGLPLLAGLSRKSTIYKTLGVGPEEALNGTTVMNTVALLHGADILRVHDVREARECVRLVSRMRGGAV